MLRSDSEVPLPKGQNFSRTAPQTSPDALTGPSYVAAMEMTQYCAPLGYSAFMVKMGVSENDARCAVSLLTEYAFQICDRVPAFRKLEAESKPAVMQTPATYACMDHCRSVVVTKTCDCHDAKGFNVANMFSVKSPAGMKAFRQRRPVAPSLESQRS